MCQHLGVEEKERSQQKQAEGATARECPCCRRREYSRRREWLTWQLLSGGQERGYSDMTFGFHRLVGMGEPELALVWPVVWREGSKEGRRA